MRAVTVVVSLLAALVAAPGTSAAFPARFEHYVALGDSYAAGPGIPTQHGSPSGCGRSTASYPGQLARWLGVADFRDVTCGGATTAHMTQPQVVPGGANPPQLDALRSETDLVTLTVGGNDWGFSEIVTTCAQTGGADPTGDPCRRRYTAGGRDVLAERADAVAAKLGAVLDGVAERAPRATVIVVGYLRILPAGAGCWPRVPFAAGDNAYFDDAQRGLDESMARAARAAGARFVGAYRFSAGRDACGSPRERWVEPLQPVSNAAPIHPNERGMTVLSGLTWLAAFRR